MDLQNVILICAVVLLIGIFIVVIYQLIVTYKSNLKYYKCVDGSCKKSIDPKDYSSETLCKAKCSSNGSPSSSKVMQNKGRRYKATASASGDYTDLSNFTSGTLYIYDGVSTFTELPPNQTTDDPQVVSVDSKTNFYISTDTNTKDRWAMAKIQMDNGFPYDKTEAFEFDFYNYNDSGNNGYYAIVWPGGPPSYAK